MEDASIKKKFFGACSVKAVQEPSEKRTKEEKKRKKCLALSVFVLCVHCEFGFLCVLILMGLSQFYIKLCVPQTNDFACRSGCCRLNRDDSADIHK